MASALGLSRYPEQVAVAVEAEALRRRELMPVAVEEEALRRRRELLPVAVEEEVLRRRLELLQVETPALQRMRRHLLILS